MIAVILPALLLLALLLRLAYIISRPRRFPSHGAPIRTMIVLGSGACTKALGGASQRGVCI